MLQIQITGNIGRNAAVKEIGGLEYIEFSLANQERKDGPTTWANVLVRKSQNGKDGRTRVWQTGTRVFVQGRPSFRAYVDKGGSPRVSLDIWASHVEITHRKRDEEVEGTEPEAQETAAAPAQTPANSEDDKDLPF